MIRDMLITDIDEVVHIEEIVFNDNWREEAFKYEICENPFSHYWVIEVDDKIIGYAGMWITFDSATITNIAILPEYQHKGWGQVAMDRIIKEANDNECEMISLEVRASNLKAIKFYKKNAFIYVNTKKGYYKDNFEDAYYMVKALGRE